ncbi:3-methyl-2-oxobutanoate hydroxymethyltransferase [Rothia kristinae]|uniref:3-methyl-2-oxobutanoate hydroxymethyltransferase n=1 Tax=Rothia kristinae TaxID=37923 RepID=A0A1S2N2L4_9MICC|nr:3-methyl-2-oxobutanoate hydroxymethyltransferase [Rothia kristinae]OIJ37019.1 3-methyl-2-oxobutanoate hydroxymethyltransferase [Rothia kristinae]
MSTYLSPEDDSPAAPSGPANGLEGVSRIRTVHLRRCKEEGARFSMLTSYDAMTARIFDEAGVEVLLVGDSAANTVLGLESTTQLRMEDFLPFVRAVSRTARRAMVVADLPFGTYEASPAQAVEAAVRLVREGGAHAVKMEGGAFYAEHVRAMVQAGVPVMAHLGFTPQSEHVLGGFRVQGRNAQAEGLVEDARRLEEAGAFAVLLEMTAAPAAAAVEAALSVPTVGIGAGAETTGQVLVWQDMAGLTTGRTPRFVKRYADLRAALIAAARDYRAEVVQGVFPGPEQTFQD